MAQPLPEWYRVYTFEDSFIEMNTALLTTIDKDVTRVRFRWTFDEPQAASETSKYKSKLEVMELNCSKMRARKYHVTLLDAAGGVVRIDDAAGEWRDVYAGGMLQKLALPACDLVKKQTSGNDAERKEAELKKVATFAFEIGQQLEQTKDFKAIVDQFFVADYISKYVQDGDNNWFRLLDRATATRALQNELQRFYVALMDSAYVGSLYMILQTPTDLPERASPEDLKRVVAPDVWQLIANHPYTAKYRRNEKEFDFLAEQINDIEQLRSYTDLLEKTAAVMRKHVRSIEVEKSDRYREVAETWQLYEPRLRPCSKPCFGLPANTQLFEVNVPVFNLQVAEIEGQLRVVSATYSFK